MTPELEALAVVAARVEALTGPDRNIDAEIAALMGLRIVEEGHPLGRVCYDSKHQAIALPSYTRSLDAAMTLAPEGWRWTAGHREFPHARGYVENGELAFVGVGTRRNPNRLWFETTAATPALALCAAALRAITPPKTTKARMMSKDATPVAESVEVTQAMRVAAAVLFDTVSQFRHPSGAAQHIIDGKGDGSPFVTAIAAAYEAGRAEGVREAAEAADKVRGGWVNGDATTPYGQAYQAGALDAATAIRALSKEHTK